MVHASRSCLAFGKACIYCKKTGHFERVCRAKQRQLDSRPRDVDVLGESEVIDDDDLLTFAVESTNEGDLENDWHVVLKFGNKNLNFKLDTGAVVM